LIDLTSASESTLYLAITWSIMSNSHTQTPITENENFNKEVKQMSQVLNI